MNSLIEIIANLLNPLFQKKENVIESYWFDIIQNALNDTGSDINIKTRLSILNLTLKSQELLNSDIINLDSENGLTSFPLFLLNNFTKDELEIPAVWELLDLLANNQKAYKKEILKFVDDKTKNIYYHNFAVVNQRILKFFNSIYFLYTMNIFKVSKTKTNKEVHAEYVVFLNDYEFEKYSKE